MSQPRTDGRAHDELRPFEFVPHFARNAVGSVLSVFGNTEVICAVTVEESVPRWMKEQNVSGGWITAEYTMLPYSTQTRKPREAARGKPDGRSVEIQRLIGRSLRAVLDLEKLGARTFNVDCDVLRADGGTRTTAICGAYVALELAVRRLREQNVLQDNPLRAQLAATSVGLVGGRALLDLNYPEDKEAAVDMNVVMTSEGRFVEVQASGEESTFTPAEFQALLDLARTGLERVFEQQRRTLHPPSETAPPVRQNCRAITDGSWILPRLAYGRNQ